MKIEFKWDVSDEWIKYDEINHSVESFEKTVAFETESMKELAKIWGETSSCSFRLSDNDIVVKEVVLDNGVA